MKGVVIINWSFIQISEKNASDILELFDDDFFFISTWPRLVSSEELFNFLIKSGKTYKIAENGNTIGLAFYAGFSEEYAFFKFKLKKAFDETGILIFRDFIKLLKTELKALKRLQTVVYEFDHSEIELLDKAEVKCEVRRKYAAYKDGRFWDTFEYSLIQDEISDLLMQ